jgi:hypothetical protein
MMREVMEEARETAREMPAFTAAFLLLVALCVGARCAVFYEADGEQPKLIAAESVSRAVTEGTDAISRMRARAECPLKTPGFTVVVGLRQYEMELSVPIASVQSLFNDAHMNVVHLAARRLDGFA